MGVECSERENENRKRKVEQVESILHVIDDDARRVTQPQPVEGFEEVAIWGEEKIRVGKNLVRPIREDLIVVIRQYREVFAYTVEEMPGIPFEVASHHLDIKPGYKPVKQKLRHQSAKRARAAKEEVDRLLKAGFIKECKYSDWLANIVLVKKPSGKWRMCVAFTDLNKACPKDDYLLPKIDKLVDCTVGHALLSFMDANAGYHQIPLAVEDRPHTAFITPTRVYCYMVMPFGLKNAGPTYQRMVKKIFKDQIGRNLEGRGLCRTPS